MGFSLYLEVNTGEFLQILRPDGGFAGNGLVDFFNMYSDYENHYQEETIEYQWFKRFESLTNMNLRSFWILITEASGNMEKKNMRDLSNARIMILLRMKKNIKRL